jgi:hypothetical protein
MVKLFDRNATQDLNLAENGFDLLAFMIKYNLAGESEIFKIPKRIGEIRLVSFRVPRDNPIPVVRKVPVVPCKRTKIGFYTKIDPV